MSNQYKAQVHFVNVHPGDCTIIKHASGHVSMIDICDGNIETYSESVYSPPPLKGSEVSGNYGMCNCNSNSVNYFLSLDIGNIFRFILTHPDMDHLDGFNRLLDEVTVVNFWDSTLRREKPSFEGGPFLEEDWDRYENVIAGKERDVKVVTPLADSKFRYANQAEDGTSGGDGLYILAPNRKLLNDADKSDDINDGSYVLLYRSIGGNILICGDAHDKTFEYIKENHLNDVQDIAVLLAPHHGRDSDRSYDFLDFIKPKLTVIGCAPSEHIDYEQWTRRGLTKIMSNQAGNIVLEITDSQIDVFVENEKFALDSSKDGSLVVNDQGYFGIWSISKS